jgi:hypothetical protein
LNQYDSTWFLFKGGREKKTAEEIEEHNTKAHKRAVARGTIGGRIGAERKFKAAKAIKLGYIDGVAENILVWHSNVKETNRKVSEVAKAVKKAIPLEWTKKSLDKYANDVKKGISK